MKRYYIALQSLDVKNDFLIKIITEYNSESILRLFEGNLDIFLTDIEWLPYKGAFENYEKVLIALERADKILALNVQHDIHTTFYGAHDYPRNLMRIDNPPAIIYYKGANPNEGFEKAIASIGTRKPTHFGFNAINYLIPQWVNEGFAIISGLAAGADRLSHIACMVEGGRTIAVLAHGLDKVYPAANRKLAEDIIKNNGTLLTEYPAGTKPDKFRFINRNRIIVGLSKVTVAMECEEKSGTMHSIEFAQKQHCPIFCPNPGNKLDSSQSGLKYILDNNIGMPIKNGIDYKGVIKSTGYNPNAPSLTTQYIKEQYLKSLLIGIEDENIIKSALTKLKLPYFTDYINHDFLLNNLLDFTYTTSYPIHNIIDIFIESIIETYDTEKES